MKYQISDLVNGPTGEIFTDKEAAERELAEVIAEGKRMNLESSYGESDLGSDGMRVEDFISLVEIADIDDSTNVDVEVMLNHGFVVVRFEHNNT